MVTCLTGEAKREGEVIVKFRYWMLQLATMDNILAVCTDIQYGTLKTTFEKNRSVIKITA